jgi:membrane protein implicated in regulation of membrane protease activity
MRKLGINLLSILCLVLAVACVATVENVKPVKDNLYSLPPANKLLTAASTYVPAPTLDKSLWIDQKLHPIPKSEAPSLGVTGTLLCVAVIIAGGVIFWLTKKPDSLIISAAGALPIAIFWLFAAYPWVLPATYGVVALAVAYLLFDYYRGKQAQKAVPELVRGAQNLKGSILKTAAPWAREDVNAILSKAQSPSTAALVDKTKTKLGI